MKIEIVKNEEINGYDVYLIDDGERLTSINFMNKNMSKLMLELKLLFDEFEIINYDELKKEGIIND